MFVKALTLILFILVTGCSHDYQHVKNVKPYEAPQMSLEEIQKEMNDLEAQRAAQKKKIIL